MAVTVAYSSVLPRWTCNIGLVKIAQFLQDAPMVKGATYTFGNVAIEVIASKQESDKVKVTVKE
jgi:hypothetical protein